MLDYMDESASETLSPTIHRLLAEELLARYKVGCHDSWNWTVNMIFIYNRVIATAYGPVTAHISIATLAEIFKLNPKIEEEYILAQMLEGS